MKTITLVNSDWFNQMNARTRRYFLRDLFALADEKDWAIRIGGEHYGS